ncbi:saccharopine dehydrogenase C-terminal domain-containing protein [Maribellus maritimus]|uniref:saccharopine dehydrogenase C-terminal domain-containing protein n=1 Tax=Maribellus maritimus TaxID=2870838 RepID=UPI001EEB087C|nr:saccharopine dehydrogenase C-terminal domain-containing protein [Maribellus maritimus]MCG6185799.1 saccharopine dehydrogenase NADP-binding domain-containing protein [Maribellus maritimus]
MKKVLLFGAGMVAKPIADYLLDHKFELTIASRTKEKADKLIQNRNNGRAVSWTIERREELDKMVSEHDLVVSLLPYTYHVNVAQACLKFKKNMVTTSYVSEEMKALHDEAKDAGIIILNEIGVDPGFDHMTAMRIIDKVHSDGGKIKEFYSLCGALAAPEEADNPFRYKFSWSPHGVIMAGNNGAKFLKKGEIVEIPTENLFKNPLQIDFPEVGRMEVYPNRDSLAYIDIYNLPDIETMFRGTFRYPNWCETLDAIKALGMVSYEKKDFKGRAYCDIIAENINVYPARVKEKVAEKLKLDLLSPAIVAMEWLGLFSRERIQLKEGSTFDLTADLMLKKMMLPDGARDMVIMLHSFLVEKANGKTEVIKSHLLDYATKEDTSIARTVALPAAIAVKMILEGKIKDTGVHIPVAKSIYEPVLNELEKLGIAMVEDWGLPVSEQLG